jgi:uncharacterized protein (TIGR03435 family)
MKVNPRRTIDRTLAHHPCNSIQPARIRIVLIAVSFAFLAIVALGQNAEIKPLTWDAISIKPHHSLDGSAMTRILPDGYEMVNMSIHSLVFEAFDIRSGDQITGWPSWANSDRFDVLAKMDEDTTAAFEKLNGKDHAQQWHLLMRQILEDRFAFKFHTEQRVLPVFNMIVVKQGSKLKPSAPGEAASSWMSPGKFSAKALSAEAIVASIGGMAGRVTFDKTGLTGLYDIELTWSPDGNPESGPEIFTALQEQLGLKLEPAKAPLDVVVLDHNERPSEN